jgi:hypothetical protein
MITAGFKICYYRTLRCIKCIKCILEAFPFNWAAGEGQKNRVGNLKGSDFYFFQNIHFLRQKQIVGK